MSASRWTQVMGLITPAKPEDLDAVLSPFDPRADKAGKTGFPEDLGDIALHVPFKDEDTVCFGARITEDTQNRVQLAMNLAQMAAEKGAEPIILSHVDYCGLERFGFRVERISGDTEDARAASEAQAVRFWNIVLVI